jgi:hypothetical protein
MTDGSSASIALDKVAIRELGDKGNMTWVYQSLVNYFGGVTTATPMLQSFPGATASVLWWTTVNMQSVSAVFLEPGLETTYAMFNRAAMQRSFNTVAEECTQTVVIPTEITAHISDFGYMFGLIFLIGLIVVNFVCLLATLPWFLAEHPIWPAIRMARDPTYFDILVTAHLPASITFTVSYSQNTMEVWTKMDNTVRVGEAIHTKDKQKLGKIVIDKPKMVTNFVTGKPYA